MKTTNAALSAVLATSIRRAADLYTFYFPEGTAYWTGSPTDLTYALNLMPKSEPLLADLPIESVGITQASMTDLGLSNGAAIPAGATDQWAYATPTLVSGTTYTISMFLKMADLSVPVLTGLSTTGDFGLVIDGTFCSTGLSVKPAGGNVYRVSAQFASTHSGAVACGVVRYATQTAKAFAVTGYQIEPRAGVGLYVKTTGAAISPTWLSSGPIMSLDVAVSTIGLEVNEMSLSFAPGARTIGPRTIKAAALGGSFDRVRVVVQRAYMATWGVIPGLVTIFDGACQGDPEIRSTEILVSVKSKTARLNRQIPQRLIQSQCPYLIYDVNCAVNPTSWTDTRSAAAGSTALVLNLNGGTSSAAANAGGFVTFTGGSLLGFTRAIRVVAGAVVTVSFPFPGAPGVGDTFTIKKGCDKTRAACRAFSNIARFGGCPDTPKPSVTQNPHPRPTEP